MDVLNLFIVLVLELNHFYVDLVDLVQKSMLFLFELFALDMQCMQRVVFLNNELFEELDSGVFQVNALSQNRELFVSPGEFFLH
jgi:hypothetical protein